MTISFTNSVGYTRSFSTNELTIVITNLNATNSYYTNGLNDLLYVRVKEGKLLLFVVALCLVLNNSLGLNHIPD